MVLYLVLLAVVTAVPAAKVFAAADQVARVRTPYRQVSQVSAAGSRLEVAGSAAQVALAVLVASSVVGQSQSSLPLAQ